MSSSPSWRAVLVLAATLLVVPIAGCLGSSPTGGAGPAGEPGLPDDEPVQPGDDPLPLRVVEARDAEGGTLWYGSTDAEGTLNVSAGPEVAELILWDGDLPYHVGPGGELTVAEDVVGEEAPVTFEDRHAFQNPDFPVQLGTTCTEKADGDTGCGLDEPSVRVDGRGWIYYTAVCCFVVDSPVWVSRDGGESFTELAHPTKDLYGNEGTITLDSAGNLYYMDIDLATFGFARWNPDLEAEYGYRRPGEPLVDRPWIRATDDGIVHAVYNTGLDTIVYRSTDHGMTFTAQPVARFGDGLGGAYSDARHGIVGMTGYGTYVESTDHGETWSERKEVQGCSSAGSYAVETAAVDEAGTVWHQLEGCVVGRSDGNWTEASQAIPDGIEPFFTWVDAGAKDSIAVAYYGRVGDEATATKLGVETDGWYLFVSLSVDGGDHWATRLADDEAVGYGDLGRRLGDFMQVDVGPDGAIHLAYARNPQMDDSATSVYKRTAPIDAMAPTRPLIGPFSG